MQTRTFNATWALAGLALVFSSLVFAGEFQPPVNYQVNPSPTAAGIGDFDRDHNVDLVVTGCGDRNCTTTASVIVLLGNGKGKFKRSGQFVAGPPDTNADTVHCDGGL